MISAVGIAGRQRCRLASGSGAAVEQARASADQRGDELRSFILDEHAAFAKRARSRQVSAYDRCERWRAVLRAQAQCLRFAALVRAPRCRGGSRCSEYAGRVCRLPMRVPHRTRPPSAAPATRDARIRAPGTQSDRRQAFPAVGSISALAIFRSTAFANGAADRFRARFTSSTLSLMAACAGLRVRKRN